MCLCFTSKKCHFSSEKTVTQQNGLLIFLGKETHSETKSWKSKNLTRKVTTTTVNLGIVEDFACESKLFHFLSFFIFFFIFSFSLFFFFHFFIFFIFSFFFLFSFFSIFHFSFSFIFFVFVLSFLFSFISLSFSFIFLSFSFSLLGAQNLIFFWASISLRFFSHLFLCKKSIFVPASGGEHPLWALFSFFSSVLFCLFLVFFIFDIFCSFLYFLIFQCFSYFFCEFF